MKPAETRYSTFLELLAVYLAIKHSHHHFAQFTSLGTSPHLAFRLANTTAGSPPGLHIPVRHRYVGSRQCCSQCIVKDCMGPTLLKNTHPVIDFLVMVKVQQKGPQLTQLQSSPHSSLSLKTIPSGHAQSCVMCLTAQSCVMCPPESLTCWHHAMFDSFYTLSHPGI